MINLGSTMGAIDFILDRVESEISHKKLLKLLYLADRESLLTEGWPITCDTLVAMEKGPVLEKVYYLLKDEDSQDRDIFLKFFNIEGSKLSRRKRFTDDWLSPNNLSILDNVCNRYGGLTGQELSEFTHRLPEWQGITPMSWEAVLERNHNPLIEVYKDLSTMLDNSPDRDELLEYV